MGLRESRILNSVHPWLRVRLDWLAEVAKLLGGGQSLISGNRTRTEQLELYESFTSRPVAYPGCSQHQYGFAADATWLPFVLLSSKARPIPITPAETNNIMAGHARRAGLTTVEGDTGHLQIYPGAMFREWAVRTGRCPANPPPRLRDQAVASSFAFRDCLLRVTAANRAGFRGNMSCPLPCGPLYGIPC